MRPKIAVVGLGYVGLPLAVAFAKSYPVVGFDVDSHRVEELKNGIDRTHEVETDELESVFIEYTTDASVLSGCNYIIVAVPTPINSAKQPDLRSLTAATKTVGENLSKGTTVVFESTVYPGLTEEICMPILERESKLSAGIDFFVGYSPERINPGDKAHTLKHVTKIVSGQTDDVCDKIANLYGAVVEGGVHRAPSIRVAEAAKVIENTQRDINIALMNEFSMVFNLMGIDTNDVLEAAGTKWNFVKFTPGLVGGHCIGVDPYYLTHKAESLGYHPQVMHAGRRINDSMGKYIASTVVKMLTRYCKDLTNVHVNLLGITFKEDVTDIRNSKSWDIVRELLDYGISVDVCDPLANTKHVSHTYGITLKDKRELPPADALILAVAHSEFRSMGWPGIKSLLKPSGTVVADVKGILPRQEYPNVTLHWRL